MQVRGKIAFAFMAFLLFVSGCDKKPERMDDYLVEFATLLKEGSSIRFQLDNGQLLIPEATTRLKERIDNALSSTTPHLRITG